jgi:hypothetical protein
MSADGGKTYSYIGNNPVASPVGLMSFTMPNVQSVIIYLKITDASNFTIGVRKVIHNNNFYTQFYPPGGKINVSPKQALPNNQTMEANLSKNTEGSIEGTISIIDNQSFIHIYPNPATDKFNITTGLSEERLKNGGNYIQITDVFGRLVAEHRIESQLDEWEFDTEFLNSGNYLARLSGRGINIVKKITLVK